MAFYPPGAEPQFVYIANTDSVILCAPMRAGKATGEYVDFMTGFVTDSGDVWGRPVGVTVDKEGALVVSDDGSNSLWRIRYKGP